MKSAGSCDNDSQTPEKMARALAEHLELDRIEQALDATQPWLSGSKSPSAFKTLGEIYAARRALERLKQFIVEALRAALARELEAASVARLDRKEDTRDKPVF